MRASVVVAAIVIAGSSVIGHSQSRVTRYDLAASPTVEIGANLRIKKIMGEVGTFMFGTFKAGWKNTPHHHTHEQVNIGVTGAFNIVTPTTPHKVSRLQGLIIPPDVMHGNDVTGETQDPLLIEFQPVRRVDFPPEREKVAFKTADAPTPAPADMDLDFRLDSPGWQRHASGVRMHIKRGKGVAVSAWQFPSATKDPVAIRAQVAGAESFVYVLEGNVTAAVGGERHVAPAGTLLVIAPGSPGVQVSATGAALLLVLEAGKAQ